MVVNKKDEEENIVTDESYSDGNLNGVYAERNEQKSTFVTFVGFLYAIYILFILFFVGLLKIFHTNFTFVASKGLLHDLNV